MCGELFSQLVLKSHGRLLVMQHWLGSVIEIGWTRFFLERSTHSARVRYSYWPLVQLLVMEFLTRAIPSLQSQREREYSPREISIRAQGEYSVSSSPSHKRIPWARTWI